MSDPKKFHKSPSQIIRSVFNSETDFIKVDDSDDFKRDNALTQICLLQNILSELKIMNFHLSSITDNDVKKDDL